MTAGFICCAPRCPPGVPSIFNQDFGYAICSVGWQRESRATSDSTLMP